MDTVWIKKKNQLSLVIFREIDLQYQYINEKVYYMEFLL